MMTACGQCAKELIKLILVCFGISGVPGVGAAVQSIQSAAEQSLSAAMMKAQVCVCVCVESLYGKENFQLY